MLRLSITNTVNTFFQEFLKSPVNSLGELIDSGIRIEFQSRGSPHAHCVVWIKGAPKYGFYDNADVLYWHIENNASLLTSLFVKIFFVFKVNSTNIPLIAGVTKVASSISHILLAMRLSYLNQVTIPLILFNG